MIDLTKSLEFLCPNEEWTLNGNEYSGLTWLSDTPKPTEQELIDVYPAAIAAIQDAEAERVAARESAMLKLAALGLNESEVAAIVGGV